MLTRLTNKLKTWYFQTPKRYLDGPDGPVELPGSNRAGLWIVPRDQLVHRTFDFPEALAVSKRDAALALQLKGWAPFEKPGYAVHWTDHRASVFAWDAKAQEARTFAKLGRARNITIVPEPFIQEPMNDGCRHLICQTGHELQCWQGGTISSSRWWKQEPTEKDVEFFLRSAKAEIAKLSPERLTIGEYPWHQDISVSDQLMLVLGDNAVTRVAGLTAVAIFSFLFVQLLTLSLVELYLRQSVSADQTYFADLRQQRRDAILNRQELVALAELNASVPQVTLYDDVLRLIQPTSAQLVIWTYVPAKLSIVLRSEESLDPTQFIREFESSERFSNVSAATIGRNQDLRLEMTVRAATALPGGGV